MPFETQAILACIAKSLPVGIAPDLLKTLSELGLDSLRLTSVIIDLEEDFEVYFDDREIERVISATDLGEMMNEVSNALRRARALRI